jgi:hypothetical protein
MFVLKNACKVSVRLRSQKTKQRSNRRSQEEFHLEQETIVPSNSKHRLSPALSKGLSEADADALTASFGRARKVLKSLNSYFSKESITGLREMDSPKSFEGPDWASRHAWYAGYRYAMRRGVELTK